MNRNLRSDRQSLPHRRKCDNKELNCNYARYGVGETSRSVNSQETMVRLHGGQQPVVADCGEDS